MDRARTVRLQSAYYILTGVFPLVSRRGFEAVTGSKTDWWLVQMVGLLAVANGLALAAGSNDRKLSAETLALSVLSAASFAAIDLVYALKRRISPIYLADAAVEALLIYGVTRP